MDKKWLIVLGTLSFLGVSVLFNMSANSAPAGAEPSATVGTVSGTVEVQKAQTQTWARCERGHKCGENDKIRTGARAGVDLMFDDGSKVSLGQETTAEVDELKVDNRSFKLNVGKLRAKIKKLPSGRSFRVNTPTAVCAVRGTEFGVEVDENNRTSITLYSGLLAVRSIEGLGEEIIVHPNERVDVLPNLPPSAPQKIQTTGRAAPSFAPTAAEFKQEVRMDMSREEVQSAAANERKLAEYQQGKSMVDVFGKRVRIEEYIVRPQADAFKLVVLNDRYENDVKRFDYFTWVATFDKPLPTDLKLATKTMWESATPPQWQLTGTDAGVSNTVDTVKWTRTGGTYDATSQKTVFNNFVLNVNNNEKIRQTSGQWYVAGQLIGNEAAFDTWINNNVTWTINAEKAYEKYTFNITQQPEYKMSEEYYMIDDNGVNVKTADYKADPMKYNQETVWTASDFKGPESKIDLVVEPQIFIDAGMKIK